ncbi:MULTISPECIES: helix-turn-helix domain-containing protein [Bacillus]|uniref:helix-turn-helix domain-containing protein n=1 Tax=Bacillus TaxID=1386 RepID=UPI000871EFC1|nr:MULTISPECIES: helix-turn-helix domain-containing protein [Bacillus cereus group]OFD02948.1 AraC family transcriptional regulator [Bacillus thuringiensis]MBJ8048228.1 AraC family transcriptional regulator [Bacillus cereus group sp. N18]MCU4770289.1 AraC family transcriptional regulator [Bacillus toyonensis]MCU5180208.1 AraC family transcriptional regulator [Bacillus toyonensis]OFD08901.1 AraC family transcriptional regulator [Bacillus thuringiensis]
MNTSIDIQHLCDLAHKAFNAPVHILSTDKKILYHSTSDDVYSPFYSSKEEHLSDIYQENDPFNLPLFRCNSYLENFVLIHIENHDHIKGTIIIGPTIHPKGSDDMTIKLQKEFKSNDKIQERLAYYQCLSEIKKTTLIDMGILLHYMIFNEKLDVGIVLEKNKVLEEVPNKIVKPDLYILKRRQNKPKTHNMALVNDFFLTIKEGNKKKLIQYMYAVSQEDVELMLIEDPLRNQKNLGIIAITLATRYAIEGNLPPDIAFAHSILYIQTLEQLDNVESAKRLSGDALRTFADRVKEFNAQKYSYAVTTCMKHINKNVYDGITLNELANHLEITPTYLSKLFKKEMGITLSEYIQRERVEEAKKLLTLTTYSLSDICAWLNFNDQSYFTRVFKKITSMTPRQYREKYTII